MVQLSHLYMTTGKTIALTVWIFVSKVMSLLFNVLSRFVMVFLPRSKRPLISWLTRLMRLVIRVVMMMMMIKISRSKPHGFH